MGVFKRTSKYRKLPTISEKEKFLNAELVKTGMLDENAPANSTSGLYFATATTGEPVEPSVQDVPDTSGVTAGASYTQAGGEGKPESGGVWENPGYSDNSDLINNDGGNADGKPILNSPWHGLADNSGNPSGSAGFGAYPSVWGTKFVTFNSDGTASQVSDSDSSPYAEAFRAYRDAFIAAGWPPNGWSNPGWVWRSYWQNFSIYNSRIDAYWPGSGSTPEWGGIVKGSPGNSPMALLGAYVWTGDQAKYNDPGSTGEKIVLQRAGLGDADFFPGDMQRRDRRTEEEEAKNQLNVGDRGWEYLDNKSQIDSEQESESPESTPPSPAQQTINRINPYDYPPPLGVGIDTDVNSEASQNAATAGAPWEGLTGQELRDALDEAMPTTQGKETDMQGFVEALGGATTAAGTFFNFLLHNSGVRQFSEDNPSQVQLSREDAQTVSNISNNYLRDNVPVEEWSNLSKQHMDNLNALLNGPNSGVNNYLEIQNQYLGGAVGQSTHDYQQDSLPDALDGFRNSVNNIGRPDAFAEHIKVDDQGTPYVDGLSDTYTFQSKYEDALGDAYFGLPDKLIRLTSGLNPNMDTPYEYTLESGEKIPIANMPMQVNFSDDKPNLTQSIQNVIKNPELLDTVSQAGNQVADQVAVCE